MVQATTPTFILTLPDDIEMDTIEHFKFSLVQESVQLDKDETDLVIDDHDIYVYLSQEETLMFKPGRARIQLNWTYDGGARACSEIMSINVSENLLLEVME